MSVSFQEDEYKYHLHPQMMLPFLKREFGGRREETSFWLLGFC